MCNSKWSRTAQIPVCSLTWRGLVVQKVQHVSAVSDVRKETQDFFTSNIVHWPAWNSLVKHKHARCRTRVMSSAVCQGPTPPRHPSAPACQRDQSWLSFELLSCLLIPVLNNSQFGYGGIKEVIWLDNKIYKNKMYLFHSSQFKVFLNGSWSHELPSASVSWFVHVALICWSVRWCEVWKEDIKYGGLSDSPEQ